MAFVYSDRVQETTTTTGTGDLVLGGVPDASYQPFGSPVMANGDTTTVAVFGAGAFETCDATYNSGPNSLTRGTIHTSSNGGARVNFGAGTKTVIMDLPAAFGRRVARAAATSVRGNATGSEALPTDLTGAQVRDSILPAGFVIDRAYAEYATNANLTTTIPQDDTIPQNTEGTQILSAALAAKSATNRVRVRVVVWGTISAVGHLTAALFVDSGANAVRTARSTVPSADYAVSVVLEYEYVPGDTASHTFAVRVGPNTGTLRLNGTSAGRLFGGTAAATLIVEEIKG